MLRPILLSSLLIATIAAPSPCPSPNISIVGYSDWAVLKADIAAYVGNEYIICPGSHFKVSPLYLL